MKNRLLPLSAFSLILLVFACESEKPVATLPRSTPENEGVSSRGILNFLDAVEKSENEMHSIMFLRHGKVIAEGWWHPYSAELKHTMYSTSKSFTSTAIGLAVSENRLTVNDKVISFFPEELPDSISPYLSELTVKNVLSMSDGMEPDLTFQVVTRDSNWVRSFLATPIIHEPGTVFLYNTLGTYMLSAIVQKVTGEKVIDYLTPRLFSPLGIEGMDWEVDPKGINTGGWGLRIKTEDMAKLGQLYLQKGKWNGQQILPESWIEEATTAVMKDSAPYLTDSLKTFSDWAQGYGYQFWRCRHNAFRADGAYGQYIIVFPEKDAVIAITSETPDMQDEINLVWEYLLPALQEGSLPADEDLSASLMQRLQSLALPLPENKPASQLQSSIVDKTFVLESNEKMIETVSFSFTGTTCHFHVNQDQDKYDLALGSGTWEFGETNRKGPYLLGQAKANYVGLPPLKVAGSYVWRDENTMELVFRYIESPHTETILCRFNKDKISLEFIPSFNPLNRQLTGKIKS